MSKNTSHHLDYNKIDFVRILSKIILENEHKTTKYVLKLYKYEM